MQELIVAGGDVNAKDISGRVPLDQAWSSPEPERESIGELLLRSGTHATPELLSRAAQWGHTHAIEMILADGVSVNSRDGENLTPLQEAAEKGHKEAVALLLARGADVNAKTTVGWREHRLTALHLAVLSLDPGITGDAVGPLITLGADVSALAQSDFTALHYAARDGHLRAAELLLAHGADTNAQTASGQTPLHLAVRRGHDEIVALLMEKGADATVKDRSGKTPLDSARSVKKAYLVAVLTGSKAAGKFADGHELAPSDSIEPGPAGTGKEPQTDVERLVWGNCAFAVDLYRKLAAQEGNLFFSPYSISTALAMTYAGARANTEREMAQVLHFSLDQQKLHPALAELQERLNKIQETGNIKLCVANSLWPQEEHPFLHEYLALLEKHYGVSITAVDYRTDAAREAARQTINRWVENKTENKIKDLIQQKHLTDATRLVLTNAIYFKGKWKNPFDSKDTQDSAFFVSPSTSIQVPTMYQREVFGYAQTKSLQILEMPYRGGELSLLVLLPTRIEGIRQLERDLSAEALQDWRSRLAQGEVMVYLPRFRMTFGAEMKETLRSMGMVDAFQWPRANFAGFDGDPKWFYIGEVVHKAYVDVNEEGTEAAAATVVEAMLGGMPPQPPVFRADHPFLFLIQENSTGSILFMGRITNPAQAGQ